VPGARGNGPRGCRMPHKLAKKLGQGHGFLLKGQFIRTNLKTRLKRQHNFSFIAALIATLRFNWVPAWIPGGSAF
jgi:hypothetical protein